MLEKSELVFQGLRLEIDFGGYPLTLQIVEDDPGMRIFVNQKDLDLISKLPNKTGLLGDQHRKTREDLYLSEALSNDEFVPIEVAADQNGCGWKTMVFKTIEDEDVEEVGAEEAADGRAGGGGGDPGDQGGST